MLDLPDPVRAAFESADSATFEVIMTDSVRMQLAQAMVLSDGRTLREHRRSACGRVPAAFRKRT